MFLFRTFHCRDRVATLSQEEPAHTGARVEVSIISLASRIAMEPPAAVRVCAAASEVSNCHRGASFHVRKEALADFCQAASKIATEAGSFG